QLAARYGKIALAGALAAGSTLAMAADGDFPIADIVTKITALLALAGAAGAGLMVISMGWDVGFGIVKKYLKKGAK
ncbi:hypothetical protein D1O90_005077, partial [Escherichia coli]|nr:hypothetical protein [Escherichia coli]